MRPAARKKSLGQNFLFDLNLTRRIARAGGPLAGSHVVEIGPGPGGLTRALLMEGADQVTAIERDSRALPALEAIADAAPGRLTILHGRRAGRRLSARCARRAGRCGSSPTCPTTSRRRSSSAGSRGGLAAAMGEHDVDVPARGGGADRGDGPAARPTAGLPSSPSGAPSPKLLFDVPPQAFTPAPKVVSSLVRFEPRHDSVDLVPATVARGHRGRLRPAPQDAAGKPSAASCPDPEPALARSRHRPAIARRAGAGGRLSAAGGGRRAAQPAGCFPGRPEPD